MIDERGVHKGYYGGGRSFFIPHHFSRLGSKRAQAFSMHRISDSYSRTKRDRTVLGLVLILGFSQDGTLLEIADFAWQICRWELL